MKAIRKTSFYSSTQVFSCLLKMPASSHFVDSHGKTLSYDYLNLRFLAASDFFLRFTLGLS